MRAALAGSVGAERALDGRAEALPLPDGSLDGAVSADAFHWFDGQRAAAELHRVLRPGVGLVVMWLIGERDRSQFEHEFEQRYIRWLLDKHAGNVSAAARAAKMDRKHLHDLARRHGLRERSGSSE